MSQPEAPNVAQQAFIEYCPYTGSPDPHIVWHAAFQAATDQIKPLVLSLRDAGFGTDDEICGSDVIDIINEHFETLERLTA